MGISEREYQEMLKRNEQLRVADDGRPSQPPAAAYRLTQAKPPTAPAPTEHEEQCALFEWAAANEGRWPQLANMAAIPNGGYRPMTTAAMLKAEGVKAGYPDIVLDAPSGRWHGLRIELKRADRSNHTTPEQDAWIVRLRAADYMAVVCYGADEAIAVITNYLSLNERGIV